MAPKTTPKRQRRKRHDVGDEDAQHRFEALHHPWRIRIVEVLSERDLSVAEFVDEALIPELAEMPRHRAISDLSYHFRDLRDAGFLAVVDERQRRGGTEKVCRALEPAYHTDAEWAKLPLATRKPITEITLDGLLARARSAILFETFDARTDRHLSSVPLNVDPRGWGELVEVMAETLGKVIQIKHDAGQRIEETKEKPIRVTWGQLGFESPPLDASR